MADIFLSYKRDDRDLAQRMFAALTAAGFSVWWDEDIDPREELDREIERELARAQTVLVLWTPNSIESEWVRDEATAAKRFRPRKLIQARFENCEIPIQFGRVPYIDLPREQPELHPNWAQLLRWLRPGGTGRSKTAPDRPSRPPAAPAPPPPPEKTVRFSDNLAGDERGTDFGWTEADLLLAGAAILFALLVGYGWFLLLFPVAGLLAALLLAATMVVLGLLLARLIGGSVAARSDGRRPLRAPSPLYLLLFAISTVAVLNGAFYWLEGRAVIGETITNASVSLLALDEAATAALREERTEAKAATAERLLVELHIATMNIATCGSGPDVKVVIRRIQAVLPDFREIRLGPDPLCNPAALQRRLEGYRGQAYYLLGLDPEQRRRATLRIQIAASTSIGQIRLDEARNELVGGGGFGRGYEPSLRAVEDSAALYSKALAALADAELEAALPLTPAIDVRQARNLGSILSLPRLLATRTDRLSTWIYFLSASTLDFFLIFLFGERSRRSSGSPPGGPSVLQRIARFSADKSFYRGVVIGIVGTMLFFLALVGLWT